MKHKVSELEGELLDAAVAKAEQLEPIPGEPSGYFYWGVESGWFAPSTYWAIGGPIIERERIRIDWRRNPEMGGNDCIAACDHLRQYGPTPLIAAMRAFVASKFGEEVDI